MGNTYANTTLRGPGREDVIAAVRHGGVRAFVSPSVEDTVVVYGKGWADAPMEPTGDAKVSRVATELSARLGCPALAVLNIDDGLLCLWVVEQAAARGEYSKSFVDGTVIPRRRAEQRRFAEALCSAFGVLGRAAQVQAVLRKAAQVPDGNEAVLRDFGKRLRRLRPGDTEERADLRFTVAGTLNIAEQLAADGGPQFTEERRRLRAVLKELDAPVDSGAPRRAVHDEEDTESFPRHAVGLHTALTDALGFGRFALGMDYADLAEGDTLYGDIRDFVEVRGGR